jgi:hypothetical protein
LHPFFVTTSFSRTKSESEKTILNTLVDRKEGIYKPDIKPGDTTAHWNFSENYWIFSHNKLNVVLNLICMVLEHIYQKLQEH